MSLNIFIKKKKEIRLTWILCWKKDYCLLDHIVRWPSPYLKKMCCYKRKLLLSSLRPKVLKRKRFIVINFLLDKTKMLAGPNSKQLLD